MGPFLEAAQIVPTLSPGPAQKGGVNDSAAPIIAGVTISVVAVVILIIVVFAIRASMAHHVAATERQNGSVELQTIPPAPETVGKQLSPQILPARMDAVLAEEISHAPKSGTCAVCKMNASTHLLVPCGHAYCAVCVQRIHECAVCKRSFIKAVSMFL